MEKHDVAIIGGGIAGLTLSKFLAEYGIDFVLLEEHKDFFMKACGEGIGIQMGEYDFFDLYESKIGIERVINECKIYTKYGEISLPIPLLTINKKEVEKEIANQAIKRGADIRMNEKVKRIERDDNIILYPQQIQAKLLVGSDGAFSIVRKYLDIKSPRYAIGASGIYKEIEKDMDKCYIEFKKEVVKYGYSWFFPKKDTWNIGIGSLYLDYFKESFKNFKEKYKVERWKGGHVPISKPLRLYGNNTILVGDAGAQVRVIVGAGNLLSMVSAKIAADTINKFSRKDFKGINTKEYEKVWKIKIGKRIEKEDKIAFLASKFMRSDYLTYFIIKILSKTASKYFKKFKEDLPRV